MPTWAVALVAVAAVTVTYFSCVRPMLRERCGTDGGNRDLDRQIAELREDIRVLRSQGSITGDR